MGEGVSPPQSYSKIFEECFPFYLSIGMSSAEYWDGDNELPQYYRKAYKMKQEQINHDAWLHGMYVYDALVSAMSHLSQNKSSHKNYTPKPYDFAKEDDERSKELKEVEAKAQAEVWMKSWVSATQGMFKNK